MWCKLLFFRKWRYWGFLYVLMFYFFAVAYVSNNYISQLCILNTSFFTSWYIGNSFLSYRLATSILSHWKQFLSILSELPTVICGNKNWISLYTPLIKRIPYFCESEDLLSTFSTCYWCSHLMWEGSPWVFIVWYHIHSSSQVAVSFHHVLYPLRILHSRKSKILFFLLIPILSWYAGTQRILLLLLLTL